MDEAEKLAKLDLSGIDLAGLIIADTRQKLANPDAAKAEWFYLQCRRANRENYSPEMHALLKEYEARTRNA
jgi:hypothetical protein